MTMAVTRMTMHHHQQKKRRMVVWILLLLVVRSSTSSKEDHVDSAARLKRLRRKLDDRESTTQQTTLGIEQVLDSQGWTIELQNDSGEYVPSPELIATQDNKDSNSTLAVVGDTGTNFELDKKLAIQKNIPSTSDEARYVFQTK